MRINFKETVSLSNIVSQNILKNFIYRISSDVLNLNLKSKKYFLNEFSLKNRLKKTNL